MSDLAAAEDWYTRVFGKEPDLRTMPGLHDGPQQATTSRILALTDPDGNRLVFTGSLA